MSDKKLIHTVCTCVTLICLLAWLSGYVSGLRGWWWTGILVLIVYAITYSALSGGGHGH